MGGGGYKIFSWSMRLSCCQKTLSRVRPYYPMHGGRSNMPHGAEGDISLRASIGRFGFVPEGHKPKAKSTVTCATIGEANRCAVNGHGYACFTLAFPQGTYIYGIPGANKNEGRGGGPEFC